MHALLAADDALAASELQSRLLGAGLECPHLVAHSLADAKAHIRRGDAPPDVIFIHLPAASRLGCEAIRDFRATTAAPIIAIGSGGDVSEVLSTVRAGASDYVVFSDRLASELNATLRRLRASLTSQTGKLWGVIGASGGSGASLIAINLAAAFAKSATACVCDLHLRGGDCAALFDLQPPHTLADLCSQGHRLDATMFEQALARHASGVRLLSAPDESAPPLEALDNLDSLLQFAQTSFQHVVLDLDAAAESLDYAAGRCDRLLIVMRPDFPSLLRTRRLLKSLADRSCPLDRVQLVANRVGQAGELPLHKAGEMIGMAITHTIPDDVTHVLASVNLGSPVVQEYPRSKAAKAILKLAAALLAMETSA